MTVQEVANSAYIYIPFNCEAIQISYCDNDENCFYGNGEETGEEYCIEYKEVDFATDQFYKLVPIETN